jgi:hypothetical protein
MESSADPCRVDERHVGEIEYDRQHVTGSQEGVERGSGLPAAIVREPRAARCLTLALGEAHIGASSSGLIRTGCGAETRPRLARRSSLSLLVDGESLDFSTSAALSPAAHKVPGQLS